MNRLALLKVKRLPIILEITFLNKRKSDKLKNPFAERVRRHKTQIIINSQMIKSKLSILESNNLVLSFLKKYLL
jgi:hypothetical protein